MDIHIKAEPPDDDWNENVDYNMVNSNNTGTSSSQGENEPSEMLPFSWKREAVTNSDSEKSFKESVDTLDFKVKVEPSDDGWIDSDEDNVNSSHLADNVMEEPPDLENEEQNTAPLASFTEGTSGSLKVKLEPYNGDTGWRECDEDIVKSSENEGLNIVPEASFSKDVTGSLPVKLEPRDGDTGWRECGVSLQEYQDGINRQCADGHQIAEPSSVEEEVSRDASEMFQRADVYPDVTENPQYNQFHPTAESTLIDEVIGEPAEDDKMENVESSFEVEAVHESDFEAFQLAEVPCNDVSIEELSSDEAEDQSAVLNVTFNIPQPIAEESLPNLEAHTDLERDDNIRYAVENSGSQRGNPVLVDSMGFSYVMRKECRGKVYWRCSVRGRSLTCRATVIQQGEKMVRSCLQHCHEGRPGLLQALQVKEEVRTSAKSHIYRPAAAIVEEVVDRSTEENAGPSCLPSFYTLVRSANRVRQGMRPDEPRDLQFDLRDDVIPEGFLLDDVRVGEERHLIFATPEQRKLLGKAKSWYVDRTFQVVREPFSQLLSIHAFVRQDSATKQVPLVFALMSRRHRRDYIAVFRAVVNAVPEHHVQEVTIDFESALWQGFASVFPQVSQRGCSFHMKQAMWQKAQEIGLQHAYLEDRVINQLLKEAMSLQYLPAEQIPVMFDTLRAQANTPMLNEFFLYIERQWLNGPFQVQQWSVYRHAVRTNKDVEGWHHRITYRLGQKLGIYRLASEMHKEARFATLQVRLLSEQGLVRKQKKAYKTAQARLFQMWEEYPVQRSAASLLRGCAAIFGKVGK